MQPITLKNLMDLKQVIDADIQRAVKDSNNQCAALKTTTSTIMCSMLVKSDFDKLMAEIVTLQTTVAQLKKELCAIKNTQTVDHMTLVTQKQSSELVLQNQEQKIYNNVVDSISKNILPKVSAAVNYMNYCNEDPYKAINAHRLNQFTEQNGVKSITLGNDKPRPFNLFFGDDEAI